MRLTNNTIGQTYVYLKRPDTTVMASTVGSAVSFDLPSQNLPTTGTYTILVDPQGDRTGTINVAVTSP